MTMPIREVGSQSAGANAASLGAVELEMRLLERSYAHLRVRAPSAQACLLASLASEGQHHPVLVVVREEGRYALIDGYKRVEALTQLGRDTAVALVLGLGEPEALGYCHRLQHGTRRSALEEGWLVAELREQRQGLPRISAMMGRSVSWVSRRLGLAGGLPDKVTKAVQKGQLPAHGAMKSLLPLARANRSDCEKLCEGLGETRLSSRQLGVLYTAWRGAEASLRERIVTAPLLFLKAKEAVSPELPVGMGRLVVRELEAARGALRKASDSVVRAWAIEGAVLSSPEVERAAVRCTEAYEELTGRLEEPDAK